ncbi:hypothetical protein [Clostridium perfringens]|uniref:ATP-binding protein n=1 Tax=Clostridium perfringens TaxID=1502 RepID=A0A140GRR4_CLOPF|nr:hypothetical protein [Clostridium perfringens]AMN31223.1 hypothetical protein JFP838_pA0307 [Clostridium perfringens]
MNKKYELGLSLNYVSDWDYKDAIREFIQNGIDHATTTNNNDFDIYYKKETETLLLCNKTSILEKRSLLLGYSTKSNDNNLIGEFGEGYKVSLLVLTRLNKKVTIYNYGKNEIWTTRIVKSKRYEGEEVLNVYVKTEFDKIRSSEYSLVIAIENISIDEFEEIKKRTLLLNDDIEGLRADGYGSILLNDNLRGNIYVNGLYITHIDNLKYGYDILPKHIKIGRDRDLINNYDILSKTFMICLNTLSDEEFKELIETNSLDTSNATEGVIQANCDNNSMRKISRIAEDLYINFKEINGESSFPVDSDWLKKDMKDEYPSINPVTTTASKASLIRNFTSYYSDLNKIKVSKNPLELAIDDLENWKAKNTNSLPENEISELSEIINRIKLQINKNSNNYFGEAPF